MSDEKRIEKVLVANRGEIAIRVFNTCHELGIRSVSVYSDADQSAPHRFAADESHPIGPAAANLSYLNVDAILGAAKATGADAIHPGYGFLSENADFSRQVEAAGLVFIGPTAEHISAMGDKVRARELMEAAGVPVVPGTATPVENWEQLEIDATRVGFPLLIKAAGGGGGKGIRRVDEPSQLKSAWERATSEATAAFGDGRVYLERYIENARHVEAQILGDGHGGALFLGERDCSLQRKHQKLIEESPSPAVDEEARGRIREASLAGVRAIQYRGAGTFEYLFDESTREFFFLEMNTRLQVEHPVTEMVTRRDLVADQLRIAGGARLTNEVEPKLHGHSIELRVYAEDPYRGFVPSTGTIQALRLPHTPFSRIDHGLRDHYEVSPYYDPMLAKLIVWGETRQQAIERLRALIERTRIGGIHTTLPLGLDICRWEAFRSGSFHTGSLEAWMETRKLVPQEAPPISVQLAGLVARHAISSRRRPPAADQPRDGGAWGQQARREGIRALHR